MKYISEYTIYYVILIENVTNICMCESRKTVTVWFTLTKQYSSIWNKETAVVQTNFILFILPLYLGVSKTLKLRLSNLPKSLRLLSLYPRSSSRSEILSGRRPVDQLFLAVEFQTQGPVTELAGQIQAMHNNRSPRKLWGWMVSGWIKQGGSM